jgi:2-polyprenyl-3-methyl-5-hydroxy-6-metoxy-1,4-benzoquinol methylase
LLPPSLAGLRVLELGAGIGRFTRALGEAGAAHVHAVDFMKNLIEEVRRSSVRSCR